MTVTDLPGRIPNLIDAVRRDSGVPGLAVSLAHDGKHYFAASGVAKVGTDKAIGADARFDLSCLMKFFLSVTALKLAAGKELDLQADIATLLPELGPARGIRLAHLMSHAGGYHGLDITDMAVRWNSKWDGFAARFREGRQLFAPGSTFNYEHSEHVILGEALRRRFGSGPLELVHAVLLSEAGIRLHDSPAADGQVCSHAFSPQKMAYVPARLPPFGPFWEASLPATTITLDEVTAAAGAALADPDIKEGLHKAVIGLPELARSEPRAEQPPRRFSAACGLYEGGFLGHNGSMAGQTIGFRADPETGAVAAAAVNAYSPQARDSVLRGILDLVASRDPAPHLSDRSYPPDFLFGGMPLEALEGRYIGSYQGEISLQRDGADLCLAVGPAGTRQSHIRIAQESEGYSIRSRMPCALRFTQAADGAPLLYLGVHAYKAVGRP